MGVGVDVSERGRKSDIPYTGGLSPSKGNPVATGDLPESSPIWCRRCSALVAFSGSDLCGRCLGALKLDGGVQYMDHTAAGLAVALLVPWQVLELAAAAGAVLPW